MKDNKIIAEFMEYELEGEVWVATMSKEDDTHLGRHLLFQTSWDWLMPVIDKCYQEHMSKHIADAVMTCDIDKAHQVIVEFINQLNK